MKKLLLIVAIAFAGISAMAEKSGVKAEAKSEAAVVSLSGNVIDQVSGEALVGVEIKLEGSETKAYTDFDGHFELKNVQAGDCKLVASYTSYNKTEKKMIVSSKNNKVKIELQASK